MKDGWIEFWRTSYGFIHTDDGLSYFLHISDCVGFAPTKGRMVSFTIGKSSKGPIALDVRPTVKTELEKMTSLGGAQ